jgi:hypothetical protein
MNPFLEIPLIVGNTESIINFKPGEIECYFPKDTGTKIIMKSGHHFQTPVSMEQLDSMLVNYAGFLKKNPGKFGMLKETPKQQSPLAAVE